MMPLPTFWTIFKRTFTRKHSNSGKAIPIPWMTTKHLNNCWTIRELVCSHTGMALPKQKKGSRARPKPRSGAFHWQETKHLEHAYIQASLLNKGLFLRAHTNYDECELSLFVCTCVSNK